MLSLARWTAVTSAVQVLAGEMVSLAQAPTPVTELTVMLAEDMSMELLRLQVTMKLLSVPAAR